MKILNCRNERLLVISFDIQVPKKVHVHVELIAAKAKTNTKTVISVATFCAVVVYAVTDDIITVIAFGFISWKLAA